MYMIYRNLNNKKLSIKDSTTGLVVGHCDRVLLTSCCFVVNKSGHKRVLESNQKNVHAYVKGEVIEVVNFVPRNNRALYMLTADNEPTYLQHRANYNPFKFDCFYNVCTMERIERADQVCISKDGSIWYS